MHVHVALVQRRVQAADDVVDVVDAVAEVGVVHAGEHRRQPVALQAQRVVGAVQALADEVLDAMQQLGIVEQQRVHVDEFADLVRQRAVQAVAQRQHLGAHRLDGSVQARQLGVDGGRVDAVLGHVQHVRQAQPRPSQRIAAGGTVAGQDVPHLAGRPGHVPQSRDLRARPQVVRRCHGAALPPARAPRMPGRGAVSMIPSRAARGGGRTSFPRRSAARTARRAHRPPPPRPRLRRAASPACRARRPAASRP